MSKNEEYEEILKEVTSVRGWLQKGQEEVNGSLRPIMYREIQGNLFRQVEGPYETDGDITLVRAGKNHQQVLEDFRKRGYPQTRVSPDLLHMFPAEEAAASSMPSAHATDMGNEGKPSQALSNTEAHAPRIDAAQDAAKAAENAAGRAEQLFGDVERVPSEPTERAFQAAEKMSGKTKWIIGGIAAVTAVGLGALLFPGNKKQSHVEREEQRQAGNGQAFGM